MGDVIAGALAALAGSGAFFDLRAEIRNLTVDLANNLLVGLTGVDAATRKRLQELMDRFFIGAMAPVRVLAKGVLWLLGRG
jgi:hypothetical protein